MSENISMQLYGKDVLVAEHILDDTLFKMNESVRIEKKGDPNNNNIGVISGILHKMNNSAIIYMVHFGHNMQGHDANYLESHLVKVTTAIGGRRRHKSRKLRKGRKTRRRY